MFLSSLTISAALLGAVAPALAQNSSGGNNGGQNSNPIPRPGAIPLTPRPGAIPMVRPPLGAVPAPISPTNGNTGGRPIIVTPPVFCPPVTYYPAYPQGVYVFPPGMTQTYVERYPSVPGSVHYNERTTYVSGYGYVPVYPPSVQVIQENRLGPTVDLGNGTRVTLFKSYRTTFIGGQTVISPFGVSYGCQPYLAQSVVIGTPYPYASGVNIGPIQPWTDTDAFVAADLNRGRRLRAALNDLSRCWENGDLVSFGRRLTPDMSVAVFQNERFLYSLRSADLYALTADTVNGTDTLSFRFTDIRERNDGLVSAYATHVYRVRGENEARSAKIRCTLVYLEGDWYLSSLSLAPGTVR